MDTQTIQPGQIQNDKLVAIGGAEGGSRFDPSIAEFTTFMINLDTWGFPEAIKDSAYQLHKTNRIFKVTKAQFKLTEEQKRLGAINEADFKKAQDKFDAANKKTGKLFAQVKGEYLAWFDKNMPNKEIKLFNCYSKTEVAMINLYQWFKAHTYDLAKAGVVSVKA